jgi:acyl-coenzyme A synthetase/AMP-(fatty) acid ligase
VTFQTICAAAHEHPSKPAIVYNGNAISYAAFSHAIGTTSRYLETQELPAGSTVVVIIPNLRDCWVVVLALQSLGLNTVCVGSVAVLETLRLNNISGIVTTEIEVPMHRLESDTSTVNRIITIPNPSFGTDGFLPNPAIKASATIGGHILYTSGTTGRYKKLLWAGDLQQRRDVERIAIDDYNTDTVYHCANLGLWTSAGYKIPRTLWQARGCLILDQRPQWCDYFLQSGMTKAFLVPDLANQLLNTLDEQGSSSSPLDFSLTVAGGFISRNLAEQLIKRVTTNLRILYGSTEINVLVLEAKLTNLDDLHWLCCRDNRIVEIIDEAGSICPIDVEGQLRVRLSELDCFSYLGDLEASEKVFRSGYFYPGDMAVRRADGRICILGRSADVVNFRGQKLAVAPIEHNIQNHLGVEIVCLFSGINSEGEEEVVIAIESDHWPEKSRLNHLGNEFAQFDQVRFAIVYPFPRTQTGTSKVDRVALRKLIFPVPS